MEQHLLGRVCISMVALPKKMFPLREMCIIHSIPPPTRKGMMRWWVKALAARVWWSSLRWAKCVATEWRGRKSHVVALRFQAVNWFVRVLFTGLYRIFSVGIELPSWGCWGWEVLCPPGVPAWYWCSTRISFPLGSILEMAFSVPGCSEVLGFPKLKISVIQLNKVYKFLQNFLCTWLPSTLEFIFNTARGKNAAVQVLILNRIFTLVLFALFCFSCRIL